MTRRSRDEIIELFKACQAKLGKVPGHSAFAKETGVKLSEVNYYWPTFGKLVGEVGAKINEFVARLPDDVVFREYGRVCLHLGKIPTEKELRIAQRELKTRTHTVRTRHGSIWAFREKFRLWLLSAEAQFKPILGFDGWRERPDVGIEAPDSGIYRRYLWDEIAYPRMVRHSNGTVDDIVQWRESHGKPPVPPSWETNPPPPYRTNRPPQRSSIQVLQDLGFRQRANELGDAALS